MGGTLRRSRRGQALILFALTFVVIVGFASLAIDGSHLYMVHRQDQNAADAGALAGTAVFSKLATPISAAPLSDADPAIKVVHDIVEADGIPTLYPSGCNAHTTSGTLNRYTVTWLDTAAACTATTGFNFKVTVQVPPAVLVGPCVSNPYNCIEVDINDRVTNYLLGTLGTPTTQSFVSATAYAKQVVPGVAFTAVPPNAVWLYEGQGSTTCTTNTIQCFNRSQAPAKSNLGCSTGSCPTLWAGANTNPQFIGINGCVAVSPKTDELALYSNGDMVLQAPTTVTDPFSGTGCGGGTQGYAVTAGSNIYCSSKNPAAGTPCNTTRPGNPNPPNPALSTLSGNEATPPAPFSFTPTVSAPNTCGVLVLNGEAISASTHPALDSSCIPPVSDQYTILPGVYQYIVINHGQYTFERGLYDITGVAPVTSKTSGIAADGIDHSNESKATDFDLCTVNAITNPPACPTLTAGVWIGNGRLGFTAASAGNSSQCAPGQPQSGTQGGGGGPTIVDGSGVSFRLRSTSGGFVSTGEVQTINIAGPGPGSLAAINGAPTLIDMESPTATIHLDAVGSSVIGSATVTSGFAGLVYQTQTAAAGGVELDPSLSGTSTNPALTGQIVAYSLTLFGGNGALTPPAVDFSQGYGTGSSVIVPTARNEPTIIGSNVPAHQPPYTLVDNGDGTETYTEFYGDEFALDGYDTYFKVNGGNPIFFSKGIWAPQPNAGDPLPPNGTQQTNPDDNNPARPDDTSPGVYSVRSTSGTNANGKAHDWTYAGTDSSLATGADPSGKFKFETNGFWTWGHETLIPGNLRLTDQSNQTSVSLTFPKQTGKTVQVQGYLTDGDRCGDFATFDVTLTQPGGPGGGSVPVPGGEQLMQ
jgi:Flp pilus assembly protein TadG